MRLFCLGMAFKSSGTLRLLTGLATDHSLLNEAAYTNCEPRFADVCKQIRVGCDNTSSTIRYRLTVEKAADATCNGD